MYVRMQATTSIHTPPHTHTFTHHTFHPRQAFRWTLTATTKMKSYVVPFITMFLMTPNNLIEESWEFWDTSILPN